MKRRLMALLLVLVTLMQTFAFAAQISDFKDFPKNWSTEAMTAAVENGLIIGRAQDRIEPNAILTRAEMTAIITRAFGATTKVDISHVKDVPANKWFADPIAKAYKMGVFSGVSPDTFLPNDPIKREDVFLGLSRVLLISSEEYSVLDQFKDKADVDSWAKNAVTGMVAVDYLHGYGNGLLLPRGFITRAELAQVFHNIFKTYISAPGTYNSVAPVGSVIIRAPGVTLRDVTINGDLVLADGIGAGDCNLINVKVNGRIICRGGEGTVTFTNVTSTGKVIINDVNGTVNFHNYRTDIPFHNNLIENTPATFLERTGGGGYTGGGGGGGITSYTYNVYYKFQNINDDDYGTDTADVEQKNLGPVTSGTKVTVATPTFSGFEFDKIVVNNKDQTTNNVTINSKNRDIYVYYTRNSYEVNFYDGVDGGNVVYTDNVKHNGFVTVPADPQAPAGKKFAGWSDVPSGTVSDIKDVATYPITGETKFYPVFVDDTVVVTTYEVKFYDKDGAQYGATQNVPEGAFANVPPVNPAAPAGKEFKGWALVNNGTDADIVDVATYAINANTDFYPVFVDSGVESYLYHIQYALQRLEGGYLAQTNTFGPVESGTIVTIVPPVYQGYNLTEIDTNISGLEVDQNNMICIDRDNIIIHLRYDRNIYDVRFFDKEFNGTQIGNTQKVKFEDKAVAPADPQAPAGKKFAGWALCGTGGSIQDIATYAITRNTDFYPVFVDESVNSYTVRFFDANGGLYGTKQTIVEGGFATQPAVNPAAPSGMEFAGWSTDGINVIDVTTYVINEDTDFYPVFVKKSVYEVTFVDKDGNKYGEAQYVAPGKFAVAPAIPPQGEEGYEFDYWQVKGQKVTVSSYPIVEDTTFRPVFKKVSYEVKFFDGTGALVSSQNVDFEEYAQAPANPQAPAGKYFAGWSVDGTESGIKDISTYPIRKNEEFRPVFLDNPVVKYDVVFLDKDGYVYGAPQTIVAGTYAVEPSLKPAGEHGYEFDYWEVSGVRVDVSTYPINSDTTFVPVFKKLEFEVKFFDGTGAQIGATQNVKFQEFATAPANPTAPAGKYFAGWSYDGTVAGIVDVSTYPIEKAENFVPIFLDLGITTHEVKFLDKDGNQYGAIQTVEAGKYANEPAIKPEGEEGYEFDYWTVNGVKVDVSTYPITDETVFVPVFKKMTYVVKFFDKDGIMIGTPQNVKYKEYATAPADPQAPAGKYFAGWSTNGTAANIKDVATYPIVKNENFTPVFLDLGITTYKVRFLDKDGNDFVPVQEIEAGKFARKPATNPEGEYGYTFEGWGINGVPTMVEYKAITEDTVFTPIFTKTLFKVNFYDGDGSVLKTQGVKYQEYAEAPAITAPAGMQFVGWSIDTTVGGIKNIANYPITKDENFYPVFKEIPVEKFTVTFLDKDGNVYGTPQEIAKGALATEPVVNPEGEVGYEFDYWTVNGVKVTVSEYPINEDTTFTPVFKKSAYEVKFVDGQGFQIGSTQKVEYLAFATAPADPAAPAGKFFAGWSVEGTAQVIVDVDTYAIKGNTTFIPVFNDLPVTTYEVKFLDKDGAQYGDIQIVEEGKFAKKPTTNPMGETGYEFDYWSVNGQKVDVATYAINADTTFEPVFKKMTYIVKFFDGEGTQIGTEQYVKYLDKAVAPGDPVAPAGYTFAGWSVDTTVTGIKDVANYPITENTNFTPIFTLVPVIKYEVKFLDKDGNQYGDIQEVVEGGYAFEPAIKPDGEEGYEFDYWTVKGVKVDNVRTYAINEDTVFEPVFKIKTFRVRFYDGRGYKIDQQTVEYGDYAVEPNVTLETPVGQKFIGWSVDGVNTVVVDFYEITENTDFRPLFGPETYTVVFRNEGVTVKTQQVEYGKYAQAPADPAKDEDAQFTYTFAGWAVDGTVVDVADYEIKKATVFEATYTKTPKVYTVRFLVDGTVYDGNIFTDKKYGDTVDVPTGTPTKPGDKYYTYTFSHWSDTVDGAAFDFSAYTVTGNKDFYAVFTKTPVYYTVTFIADGQEFHKVENIVYEGTSGLPANNPSKANHTFEGWFTKPDGEGEKYLGTEKITENLVVYAHLKALTVKVEFYDEVLIKTVSDLEYGDTVAAAEFPAKKPDVEGFIRRESASDLYNNEIHTIPYVWLYQTEDGVWHEFDETVEVKKEVLKVYRRVKRVSAFVDVSEYISRLPEIMISVAYTDQTRAADSIKDALFINANLLIQAYDKSGAEDKAFAKLRQYGFIDNARGINNINRFVNFADIPGFDLEGFLREQLNSNMTEDSIDSVADALIGRNPADAADDLVIFVDAMLVQDHNGTRSYMFNLVHEVIEDQDWHKFDNLINKHIAEALNPENPNQAEYRQSMEQHIIDVLVEFDEQTMDKTTGEHSPVFEDFIEDIYMVIHKETIDPIFMHYIIDNKMYDLVVEDFFADTTTPTQREKVVEQFIDHLAETEGNKGAIVLESFIDEIIDDIIADDHADNEVVDLALGLIIDELNAGNRYFLEKFVERFLKLDNLLEVAKESNFTELYHRLSDSEVFIEELTHPDKYDSKFSVTPYNHFVIEQITKYFERFDSAEDIFEFLENRGVPTKILNQLKTEELDSFIEIFQRTIPEFTKTVKQAMADTEGKPEGTVIYVDSGVTISFNPVSEVYGPLFDYAYGKYTGIDNPNADGIKQKIYDYVIANPYYEDILNLVSVENMFNGSANAYTEVKSGFSIKEFDEEGGYLHLIQNFAVLTDDAVMWYFDDANVPADLRDKVLEAFANRVVGYMNIFMDLLNNYSENGLPTGVNQIYEDILAYDLASGDFEKVMGKVEDISGIDARGYFEKLVNHRIVEKGYTKAIDKFSARIEIVVEKLASSRLDREYTDADAQKLVDIINGLFDENPEKLITLDTVLDKLPGKTSEEYMLPDNTPETTDNYVETVDSWSKTVKNLIVELVRELTSLF